MLARCHSFRMSLMNLKGLRCFRMRAMKLRCSAFKMNLMSLWWHYLFSHHPYRVDKPNFFKMS